MSDSPLLDLSGGKHVNDCFGEVTLDIELRNHTVEGGVIQLLRLFVDALCGLNLTSRQDSVSSMNQLITQITRK